MPKKAKVPKLKPAQIIALENLLAGKTQIDAAAAAGVSRQSLTGWLKNDVLFAKTLNEGQALMMAQLNTRLLSLGDSAIEQLKDVLESPLNQPIGLRAADIVLSKLLTIREATELELRLTALEQALDIISIKKGQRDEVG